MNINQTNLKTVGSKSIQLNQLSTLAEHDRVNVKVTIAQINDPQTTTIGKIKHEVTIANLSGTTTLTIWGDLVNTLKLGQSYEMSRLEVRSYMGKDTRNLPPLGATIDTIADIVGVVEMESKIDENINGTTM